MKLACPPNTCKDPRVARPSRLLAEAWQLRKCGGKGRKQSYICQLTVWHEPYFSGYGYNYNYCLETSCSEQIQGVTAVPVSISPTNAGSSTPLTTGWNALIKGPFWSPDVQMGVHVKHLWQGRLCYLLSLHYRLFDQSNARRGSVCRREICFPKLGDFKSLANVRGQGDTSKSGVLLHQVSS